MAEKSIVIDAESHPISTAAADNTHSIPVKIDATQMQNVLQAIANQSAAGQIPGAEEKINPSVFIKNIAQDMESLYARFDKLKLLAAELNGLPVTNSLPPTVSLKNILINFAITKNGKTEEHSAEIRHLATIGDITGLLSSEFGLIISALHDQSQQVEDLAKRTTERCGSALKEWEEKNQDRKIVRVDRTTDQPVDVENSETST